MSDWKISRRPLIVGAIAAAAAAAIGGAYEAGLFRRRASGPYGDLLSQLDDLDDAKSVGAVYLAATPGFNAAQTAKQLRARHQSLSEMLSRDIAGNQLAEAGGWVLPESLALLCALAATHA